MTVISAAEPLLTAQAVDRDAVLADLFLEHHRSLVRLAALLLDDAGAAEDVVQDAWVRLYGSLHRVRDQKAVVPYLRSIVLNLARSRLRRRLVARRHQARPEPDAPGADERIALGDDQRKVLAALRSLPARQREVLVLRYWLDLSGAEIGATLGISEGAVKAHTHRAMAALTRLLGEGTK